MAFVINRSEYKSVFDQVNKNPGPGAYQSVQTVKEENPAPFNASSSKISCFNFKQSSLGPGSYSRTGLHECFKKRPSCVSSFKSQAPRFPYQRKSNKIQTQPQTQYQSQKSLLNCQNSLQNIFTGKFQQKKLKQKKQYMLNLRKKNQQRKTNSIVNDKKGKIRILISNPQNTQNIESFYIEEFIKIRQGNGPGAHEISRPLEENNRSVIDWSKDKQQRFKKSKSMSCHPGPGSYQLDKKPKNYYRNRNTSSFSSGEVRSYLDTLLYKTNSLTKVQIMQSQGMKQRSPGPADYCPQKPQKDSFYKGKEIMSSTVERFATNKGKTVTPGPGYYKNSDGKFKYHSIVKEMRQKIFGKQPAKKQSKTQQGFMTLQAQLRNINQQAKRDDSYHVVPCTLKERCESKAGTMSHEARFKDLIRMKNKVPGPGQYLDLFEKKNPPQTSSIFKSCTERQPYIINQESVETFYEVGKNDIGAKTQKIRQNIKSLKKVAIQKPAFDSSVCRFPTQESSKTLPSTVTDQYSGVFYEKDQIDYQSFKPYKQKGSCGSVFRSTTTRQPFVIKSNPGPGSYQQPDFLNKKSYNAQYYLIDHSRVNARQKTEIQ